NPQSREAAKPALETSHHRCSPRANNGSRRRPGPDPDRNPSERRLDPPFCPRQNIDALEPFSSRGWLGETIGDSVSYQPGISRSRRAPKGGGKTDAPPVVITRPIARCATAHVPRRKNLQRNEARKVTSVEG